MKKLLYIATLTVLAACKPAASDSEVQSLDNFTRADGAAVKPNDCGYRVTETAFQKLSANDKKAMDHVDAPTRALALDAYGALAAVPRPMLSLFFKLDGKVRVVEDVKKACDEVKLSASERKFAGEGTADLDGCWNAAKDRLEIILKADHSSIQHATVRIFGYVYTQYLPTLDLSRLKAAEQAEAKKVLANLTKQKQAVGDALLADVAKKGGQASARFAQFSASPEYDDFAVAEAIDSYYCSKKSRKTFEDDFKKTFEAFTGAASIQSDLGPAYYE